MQSADQMQLIWVKFLATFSEVLNILFDVMTSIVSLNFSLYDTKRAQSQRTYPNAFNIMITCITQRGFP